MRRVRPTLNAKEHFKLTQERESRQKAEDDAARAKEQAEREARAEKQVKAVMDEAMKEKGGPLGAARGGGNARGRPRKEMSNVDDEEDDEDGMEIDAADTGKKKRLKGGRRRTGAETRSFMTTCRWSTRSRSPCRLRIETRRTSWRGRSSSRSHASARGAPARLPAGGEARLTRGSSRA